jgi:hypothetical protein
MIHYVNIALTDDEYNALSAEAGRDEEVLAEHLHELLTQHLPSSFPLDRSLSERDIQQYLSHRGITYRIPTDQPEMPEEEAEDKRLADLFSQVGPDGKTVSEMVIEDRGPRECSLTAEK